MKKMFSILFALALVLSFSVVATSVSADDYYYAELVANITAPVNGVDIMGGAEFTVSANVTNNGTGYAQDVKATIEISGNATLKAVAGNVATKSVAAQLPPVNGTGQVSWVLVCTGAGAVHITVTPSGIEPNTLNPIVAGRLHSDTVSINQKKVLEVTIVAPVEPAAFNVTDEFDVTANVKNISSLNATDITLTISIDRYATLKAGAATRTVGALNAGATSANFTWTLKCTGDGFSRITVIPSGKVGGMAIPAAALTPATVTVRQGVFDEFPLPPHLFEGTASTLSPAGPVPAGTLVQAFVDGQWRVEGTTDAEGKYLLMVPGQSIDEGKTVSFKVAGVQASQTAAWYAGEVGYVDLTIPALPTVGYSLTIAVSPAGTGTATDMTNASPYAVGVQINIRAVPAAGYQFVNWTAPAGSFANASAATTTFTMPAQDVTVTANFEVIPPVQYTLTISSTAGGSVTTPGEGTFTYDEGTVVNLVATPATGYGFVNWAGDVGTIPNVNAATTNITMQGAYKISARFMAGVVAAKTETVTNSTVDAMAQAHTKVVVKGTATVTVARYEDNPGGPPPTGSSSLNPLGKYIDVSFNDTTEVTETEIQLYYTDAQVTVAGIEEESLRLFWWNETAWVQCSNGGVNTDSDYIWANIRTGTTPSLADLQGTPWGGYGHPTEIQPPWCMATVAAASSTNAARKLDILRECRDAVLLPNSLGARLVSFYYRTSPPIADFISQHEILRTTVKMAFVDPIVKILNWSHHLWSARGS
jgi:uncharacterized repeat protein (TIGR02543 family)